MLFLGLVLIQLVIFGALVFFLRVILTRNISHATSHLHELNEDYTQKLEDAKKRQVEAEKYYDEMVMKSKTDAERVKVQILKEAHAAEEQMLQEARNQSQDIITQANRAKETLLNEFDQKVAERSVDRASEFVREILTAQMTKKIHEGWVEELLKFGLEELERLNLPDDIKEAEVTTAYELGAQQKLQLEKKIESKTKRVIHLQEKVEPEMIAGFKIKLGSVMIDGSLDCKIKEIARHAKRLHAQ